MDHTCWIERQIEPPCEGCHNLRQSKATRQADRYCNALIPCTRLPIKRPKRARVLRAVWGQELGEEGDYLIRTSGGKDFAKRVQTESEQRPSAAAVFFDWNSMQTRLFDAGFHRCLLYTSPSPRDGLLSR